MKKRGRIILYTTVVIAVAWGTLTLVAAKKGAAKKWMFGSPSSLKKALIVYNPDLFYNLDEQVCKAFAEELKGMQVTVATVAAAGTIRDQNFDLYIFCANTYNWRPDWPASNFIKGHPLLKNKPVVAITLGSGSTGSSQKKLETIINEKGARLIGSRSFWLMKPNDELRMKEKNVSVVLSMVHEWAREILKKFNEDQLN